MPAADDLDERSLVGDFYQERGDEALAALGVAVGELRQVPADAALQGGSQFRKGGVLVSGLAERAENGGGVLDGGQALATDIADEEPGRPAGPGGGVQVAAHQGVRRGCPVRTGDAQRTQLPGQGAQHDPLGHLGHRAHLGQFPQVAVVQLPGGDDETRYHQQGADVDRQKWRMQQAVMAVDDKHCRAGGQGGTPDETGAGERCRGGGRSDQERGQMDGYRGEGGAQSDGGDQRHRDRSLREDAARQQAAREVPQMPRAAAAGTRLSGWTLGPAGAGAGPGDRES